MKKTYELTEEDLREAVKLFIQNKTGDVIVHVTFTTVEAGESFYGTKTQVVANAATDHS